MLSKKHLLVSIVIGLIFFIGNTASAATSKIGILVFDGFLTSDVTAPVPFCWERQVFLMESVQPPGRTERKVS